MEELERLMNILDSKINEKVKLMVPDNELKHLSRDLVIDNAINSAELKQIGEINIIIARRMVEILEA